MGVAIPQVITPDRASGSQVIDGSLKFDRSKNNFLYRVFSTAGNRRTWTWAGWLKPSPDGNYKRFWGVGGDSSPSVSQNYYRHNNTGTLTIGSDTDSTHKITSQNLRDTGWYHIVIIQDTTDATAADRFRLYVNGERVTSFSTNNNFSQNAESTINNATADGNYHALGCTIANGALSSPTEPFDGAMSQVYFIDGQALEPENFGFTDPLTGTWRPKKYTGSFAGPADIKSAAGSFTQSGSQVGGPIANAYDGNTGTDGGSMSGVTVWGNSGGTATQSGLSIPFTSNVKVFYNVNTGGGTITVNGVSKDANVPSNGNTSIGTLTWTTGDISSPFTSIAEYAPSLGVGVYISGIQVDGVFLVDIPAGVNGFYLPMDGNSSIGQDKSGNGNDWTPVNFGGSVALDSPAVSGGRPFLNVTQGGTQAGVGVFGSKENRVYTVTYADDGGGNKYYIDGVKQPTLDGLIRGSTYTFDTVALGSTHPFRLSATSAHGTEYTDGVDATTGTATTITIPHDAPNSLYYYCTAHSGMGSSITSITTDETKADPYASNCVLAYSMSGGRYQEDSSLLNCTTTYKASSGGGDIATGLSTESNFYHTSLNFDGTGDHFTTPANSQFDFGTGAYTLEFWIKTTTDAGWLYYDAGSSNQGLRVCIGNNGGNSSNAGKIEFNEQVGNNDVYTQGTSRVDDGKWHHVAICRGDSGDTTKLYVNGVHEATGSANRNFDNNNTVYIGARSDGTGTNFNGNMQDFRMYKGIAKYTSNFVVPATSPDILPDTPSGATGSKLTKITDGAVIFDGTGDKLSVADTTNDDFNLGTNDFTIEYFMYKNNDMGGTRHHVGQYGTSNANRSFVIKSGQMPYHFLGFYWYNGSSEYNFNWNEGPMRTQEGWKHVCVQRKSGKLYLYIDGKMWKEDESSNAALSINNSTAPLTIGSDSNTGSELAFNGSISNFRFINGTAIYRTGGFAPPIAPLTTTSQGATESEVKLLCCQSPTSAVEAAAKPADVPWLPTGYTYWTAGMSQNWAGSGGTTSNNDDYINVALPTSGKYYWEVTINNLESVPSIYRVMGISTGAAGVGANYTNNIFGFYYNGNPPLFLTKNASGTTRAASGVSHGASVGGSTWVSGDKIMWAWDATNDKIYMGLNGTWFNSGDPVAGTGQIIDTEDLSASSYYFKLGYTADGGTPTLTTVTSGNSGSSSSLSKEGGAAATNFNPFNTDINTVRGQETGYCTWNPLVKGPRNNFADSNATFSDGNLKLVLTGSGDDVAGTMTVDSGKWYYEIKLDTAINHGAGWTLYNDFISSTYTGSTSGIVNSDGHYGTAESSSNSIIVQRGSTSAATNQFNDGSIIGYAFDIDAGTMKIYVDGIFETTISSIPSGTYVPIFGDDSSTDAAGTANFGQKPFKFPPPDGFQPLNAANARPETVIARPDQYVGTILYAGTGNTSGREISGLNFNAKPDLIWIKNRGEAVDHILFDSVRGFGANKELTPNDTYSEGQTGSGAPNTQTWGFVKSNNLNGFTVQSGSSGQSVVNNNSINYAAWCWKAGGNKNTFNVDDVGYASAAAAGLDGGSLNPTAASVGTKQGFAIIKADPNQSAETIAHGLGRKPAFIISKPLDSSSLDWNVFHQSLGTGAFLRLNATDASQSSSNYWGSGMTTTTFGVASGNNGNNQDNPIYYVWADVPGLQKFGSYEGSTTEGAFVELGFRPAIIWIKAVDQTWYFNVQDTKRSPINPSQGNFIQFNIAGAENSASANNNIDFLSNGFKIRSTTAQSEPTNVNAQTYVYCAWAEAPTFNLYGGGANAR